MKQDKQHINPGGKIGLDINKQKITAQQQKYKQPMSCPYLSTVRKNLLDFDFEKICCISLTCSNIYACLICGRYFQGRSSTSPAYQHSIQFSHYVFLNLQTAKIYCLPDGYEVDPYTVQDIRQNLQPVYTPQYLNYLDKMQDKQYNIDGRQFIPGAICLNNLGRTDYANSVIYLINCIPEIRKIFLLNTKQFSLLLRKMWNARNFKGVVNPHLFMHLILDMSGKKFKIINQADPCAFFLWLIDNLNESLKISKIKDSIDIQKLFRGKLMTSVIKGIKDSYQYEKAPEKVENINFSVLKMQFPQKGIFNKTLSQVSLQMLLQKYVGKQGQKHPQGLRYAKIMQFPKYLVLVFKRFIHNGYTVDKDNSHLVYTLKLNINSNGKKSNYRLISQICHTGDYEHGKYKNIFYMEQANKWYQIEDLQCKQMEEPEVLLAQPYMQVYKLIKCSEEKNSQPI